ncbi:MAG: aldehyde dehydrogenase family protein [Cyanobacteria bacterium QS_8_64_29]|nr:MAG: aldehyde dehydrogenase family protein [Cyanobacteria bacterium QS_8_64_29]
MAATAIPDWVAQQRQFFASGQTRPLAFRQAQLQQLRQAIAAREAAFTQALWQDCRRPPLETVAGEVSYCLQEIDCARKHLRRWARPQPAPTPLPLLPARSYTVSEPLGVVAIVSPWNYPVQLALVPLIGAIAAGNCALVKPSEVAPHAARAVSELIAATFDPALVRAVEGDKETTQQLLAQPLDHIFFTGSAAIGREVMRAAAERLIPVTLELGGKSPCLVDRQIRLNDAARRIAWGKFINAGQTCIAPDYVLAHRAIASELIAAMRDCLRTFYGEDPAQSPDYARIINDRHFERLRALIEPGQVAAGGETDPDQRYIAPTILEGVSWDDAVMQEEIFGPILPVLRYETLDDALAAIAARPKPLALYAFSQDATVRRRVLQETAAGSTCFNDTIVQFLSPHLPFGGVGASGMGSYHGRASFETFSHRRSVVRRPLWPDIKLRYPPYRGKLGALRWLLRWGS